MTDGERKAFLKGRQYQHGVDIAWLEIHRRKGLRQYWDDEKRVWVNVPESQPWEGLELTDNCWQTFKSQKIE